MRHRLSVLAAAALLALPALRAAASSRVVSVTFASVAALPSKSGERLDAKLFRFGKGDGSRGLSTREATNGLGRDKKVACRWALLAGLLKLQRQALASGKRVVHVRTYAGKLESSDPDACLCLAGSVVVRTALRADLR